MPASAPCRSTRSVPSSGVSTTASINDRISSAALVACVSGVVSASCSAVIVADQIEIRTSGRGHAIAGGVEGGAQMPANEAAAADDRNRPRARRRVCGHR
ncbi:hypothetical protein GAY31_31775 [Azospirillum brasilense]|nr:hypothetical protein [Azospirillum brasilense]